MPLEVSECTDVALHVEPIGRSLHGPTGLVAPVGPFTNHRGHDLCPLGGCHRGGNLLEPAVGQFGNRVEGRGRDLRFGVRVPVGERNVGSDVF